jgi:hypothetical protein
MPVIDSWDIPADDLDPVQGNMILSLRRHDGLLRLLLGGRVWFLRIHGAGGSAKQSNQDQSFCDHLG